MKLDDLIYICKLKIDNSKGDIYHALKSSEDSYQGFGGLLHQHQLRCLKGWKKHNRMILNLTLSWIS